VSDVDKQPRKHRVNINVYSGEEVRALVRAAASEQDAALFLTAAFHRAAHGRAARASLA
jgi:hypothetical protein